MGDVHMRGAIFDRAGTLKFIGDTAVESDTWRIYLAWPDISEVYAAKRRGDRFAKVYITETRPESPAPSTGA